MIILVKALFIKLILLNLELRNVLQVLDFDSIKKSLAIIRQNHWFLVVIKIFSTTPISNIYTKVKLGNAKQNIIIKGLNDHIYSKLTIRKISLLTSSNKFSNKINCINTTKPIVLNNT
jgi:hypothetical protein